MVAESTILELIDSMLVRPKMWAESPQYLEGALFTAFLMLIYARTSDSSNSSPTRDLMEFQRRVTEDIPHEPYTVVPLAYDPSAPGKESFETLCKRAGMVLELINSDQRSD